MADERCLLFQSDHSILLTVESAGFAAARDQLRQFAELRQAAGGYHVYRVTEIALWSAAASGLSARSMIDTLQRFGQHPPPPALLANIQQVVSRYGLLRLSGEPDRLYLIGDDRALLAQLAAGLKLEFAADSIVVPRGQRGWLKAQLADRGYPVIDEAALTASPSIEIALLPHVALRAYQERAVRRFVEGGLSGGVVLLPCGSGKTVVGVAASARLRARTLIITPSRTIGDQWIEHFRGLTTLGSGAISRFRKGSHPTEITIATYQALTARGTGAVNGLAEILDHPWGLIIYDEVHSLPADVFRQSAAVQSVRRLGLTATLVREDGREREVFSLVGPTVSSAAWRELEQQGWIAPVDCVELRIAPTNHHELTPDRLLAAKLAALRRLLDRHAGEPTLIVAQRLKEVAAAARAADAAVITGQTPLAERRARYQDFREGRVSRLALSRVANVGVDLPDASVLIQLSGAFGSRQEEAQRVGRVLRPKPGQARATFYSLVMSGTREVEFAARRQRFLVDQGYRYRVVDAGSL